MGLILHDITPSLSKVAIWDITEKEDDLFQELSLPGNDNRQIHNVRDAVRRCQWIAARVLLKRMLGAEYTVSYDDKGKPFLEGNNCHISVSHSTDKVAVMISDRHHVGVDIQCFKNKIDRVKSKYMSREELSGRTGGIAGLHVFWGAKEALYKYYGKGQVDFKCDLFIHPFTYAKRGQIVGEIRKDGINKQINLAYQESGMHTLVYTLNG